MEKSQFVHVTYIRTTPEKLWAALTAPEFTRRYWCETTQECEWKPGAVWRAKTPDGQLMLSGTVLECTPPRRAVFTWRNEMKPELQSEGHSLVTYEIEPLGDAVKLTILHQIDRADSKLIHSVSGGWPLILASLKSFLETSQPLAATSKYVPC